MDNATKNLIRSEIRKELDKRDADAADAFDEFADAVEGRLHGALRFRGIHQPPDEYFRGDVVVWRGGLYHCNKPTTERPDTSGAWSAMLKIPNR